MARGGKREGSGRKSKVDELQVRNLAVGAIEKKYGSLEDGLLALLESGDASLRKFVFEHALGKAPERIDVTTGGEAINVVFKRANG